MPVRRHVARRKRGFIAWLCVHALAFVVSVSMLLAGYTAVSLAVGGSSGIESIIRDMNLAADGSAVSSDLAPGAAPTTPGQNIIPPVHYIEDTGGVYPGEIDSSCTSSLQGVMRYSATNDRVEFCGTDNQWRAL